MLTRRWYPSNQAAADNLRRYDDANEQVSPEVWDEAANYEVDSSRWINVEEVLVTLEEKHEDGELTEAEQKLWDLCEAAEQQGLQDIVINPP